MERPKDESKLPAPCALWPVELKLTHVDCSPEDTLVHFQGQYMTICELDYDILQVEIQNAVKTQASFQVGELCLVNDAQSGRWYRGRVQNRQGDSFHVFLQDHGDILTVGSSHLSPISETLLMLPPKVVCGFFANTVPVQEQWSSSAENYLLSLIGSQIKGYIHALLPYQVLILEVPEINRDLLKLRQGRHMDTSTFLFLVEMLIEVPVQQIKESVPDLLIDKQARQEYCFKSSSLIGFEEILSLNGPKLKVGQKIQVAVTAAVNPGLFYCRLSSMGKDLQEMSDKLALACEPGSGYLSNKPLENLGLLCAVKGKDEKWHRGFVQCLPVNSQVRVVFVDSGYCESVKLENILQLPLEFLSTPIMAFPCSLSCLAEQVDTVKNQQLEALKSALLGKSIEVGINDICKDQNFYLVTLSNVEKHSEKQVEDFGKSFESDVFECKPNVPHDILSKWYNTDSKKIQKSDSVPLEAIKEGSTLEGYVLHVQNPKHFWIRTKEQNKNFESMMKEMTEYFSTVQLHEEVFEDPVPGALCCAMYEKDMHFYRALIVDTLEKGAEVFFIDFGNTEKVPAMLIKKLPKKFAIEPEFVFNCALAHVAPFQDIWPTASSDFFRQVTSNKTLLVHIIHKKNDKYIVELFEKGSENNNSIATIMTTANMAEYWRYNPALVSIELEKQCKDKGGNAMKMNKMRRGPHVVSICKRTSLKPNLTQKKPECVRENSTEPSTPNKAPKPKVVVPEHFKAIHFKPGSEVSVLCSHINSPSDFWCQNKGLNVYLNKLMEEMQMFYQTYTVILEAPAVCCAVKSPHDNRWHRACILGEDNEEFHVILVDYGILIKDRMQNFRTLAPQFFELHEQAFRCSLNLIEPAKESSWSTEACDLFRNLMYEDSPSLLCKINSQIYEQGKGLFNVVDIHTPSQQASVFLVEKGVAVIQTPKQLHSSTYPRSFVYSSFGIHSGSEELVHVTNVSSPWEIYFQLDKNTEIIDKMIERVAEESQLLITTSDLDKGNVCLAKYFCDNQWYRAQTQPVQSHQHVSVFFVDYGNKQVSEKNNVMPIPRRAIDLLMTPMQALRCSLSNVPEFELLPEVNGWLETAILNKSFQAKFVTKDNSGHFICDLYDGSVHINEKVRELMVTHDLKDSDPSDSKPSLESNKEKANGSSVSRIVNSKENNRSKIKQGSKQTSKPVKPPQRKGPIKLTSCSPKVVHSKVDLPKLGDLPAIKIKPGSRGVGFISHCNSIRSFFVQMKDDEPRILQMGEEINDTGFKESMKNVVSEVKVGDLVAAEYEEDLALYRAVVTTVSSCGHLTVEFVDYGNTATVDRKNVHMLVSIFLSQPRLSIPCTLATPHSFGNEETFIKEAIGKPLMVTFIHKLENSWEVNIRILECGDTNEDSRRYDVDQQIDLAGTLKCQDKCATGHQDKSKMYYSSTHKTKELNFQEKISELENKSNIQKSKSESSSKCQNKKKASTSLPTHGKPRGFCKRSYKKNQIGSKSEALVNFKLPCDPSISVTKNSGNSETQEYASTFNPNALETSINSPSSAKLPQQDGKENESVKNLDVLLVLDDHSPVSNSSSESSLDLETQIQTLVHAPVQMNFEYKGYAAAVTTPAEFYIILEDLLLILETVSSILENLPEVLVPLPEGCLIPGASCLVKSAEKKKWCRAEIVQCDFTSVLINLVDYGQYVVVSQKDICQLQKLPEELSRLPKVTYHCLLRGVKPSGQDWSDNANVFFQYLMCQRNLKIRFRQFVSETQWEVDIITGNQNLAKELVDAGHATYIDNMLGIRFQQELGHNWESQEAITSIVNDLTEVLSMKTDQASSVLGNSQEVLSKMNVSNESMFVQKSSQDSEVEQDAINPWNRSDDLGLKLGPASGVMM
ncbi:LOW QUALITY PROTEIN: tudor domain-containing protein 15 [Xyrauchen texanus]|uniref:LOW QUALITY PROTEIN: tudor domain-containing protein 15 n=1 Tax=Xyrauchen texanus TaxID=154827 RepID=UPI002241C24E|nr:LOW QUALITY PROTEIN: tudor domain-containing protein 15 [Xyrauchen texanus]